MSDSPTLQPLFDAEEKTINIKSKPGLTLAALLIAGCQSTSSISALDLNTHIRTASVHLTMKEGVVTLTGTVKSFYEKEEIGRAALEIDGVKEVRNHLSF